jgi:hypothetical protein
MSGCDSEPPKPTPTVGELLKPTAAPRCDEAFAGAAPVGTASPRSLAGPGLTLTQYDRRQLEEKDRGVGAPPLSPWYAGDSILLTDDQATSADALKMLICVRATHIFVGTYQPGNYSAIRVDWDVRVLRWPGGEPLAASTFRGHEPPAERRMEAAPRTSQVTGGDPLGDASKWLETLIAR